MAIDNSSIGGRVVRLTDADLSFLIEATAPQAHDKERLRAAIRDDDDLRKAVVSDERVFARLTGDEEAFVRVSPALYFEVLFRQARSELEKASHTIERTATQAVPVFDTREVVQLLSKEPVLDYLASMLSSFTRVESYVKPVRVKPGVWRRVRFSDMDIDSLIRLCEAADEEERFRYYKRIGDVCLFTLGVFPEYAQLNRGYPTAGKRRPQASIRARRGVQEYEEEGRRSYRLAGEHPTARMADLAQVFRLLHDHFSAARKPLDFISRHYLKTRRTGVFEMEPQG